MRLSRNDSIGGINESSLDNIILELGSSIDNIISLYQEIENLMYDSSEFFKGDAAESLRDKFSIFQKQFEIVKKNYTSYQDDLITIKATMLEQDNSNKSIFEGFSEQINKDAKNV